MRSGAIKAFYALGTLTMLDIVVAVLFTTFYDGDVETAHTVINGLMKGALASASIMALIVIREGCCPIRQVVHAEPDNELEDATLDQQEVVKPPSPVASKEKNQYQSVPLAVSEPSDSLPNNAQTKPEKAARI